MSPVSTLRRTAGAALVLLVVAFGLTWQAGSASATASAGVPAASDGDSGRMMLVLDSSGSMKERAAGGETKIAAAKKALGEVIGSLPPDQSVGLRVYGAKVFSKTDPGACTDSQLVVPVGTDNRGQLRSAVTKYRPYGETPIGYALQQAGKDLGSSGARTIVLVSDGEPTCAPDPCTVARDLTKKGVDLKINVVGLDVDGAARDKLQCIAGAGKGTYYDVDSSEEFAVSLQKLATRAARPFAAIGRVVTGTPTAEGAPSITAGDWQDELGTSEAELTKNYVVERKQPGSTLHISASLRTATSDGETVSLKLTTPDGEECDTDNAFTQLSDGQLISAGASGDGSDPFGDVDPQDPCLTSDRLLATVTDSATAVTGPRPLELRVIEEPPVSTTDGLPEPATTGSWTKPAAGATGRTTGGSSFADAPVLTPGSYRDAIVPGEVLTYQVELGWGQQLAAEADFPKPPQKLAQAIGNLDMFTRVDVFGPGRKRASNDTLQGAPPSQSYLPNSAAETATGTSPVAYLNRASDTAAQGADLAGRYTVTVFLEKDPQQESYVVPFTLHLGVSGEKTAGPSYTQAPAPVESASAQPTTSDQAGTRPAAAGRDDGGPGAGLYVGGLGLLALAAAGFLVLRSRSTRTT
jgi:Ca-activated chloride channel homolog